MHKLQESVAQMPTPKNKAVQQRFARIARRARSVLAFQKQDHGWIKMAYRTREEAARELTKAKIPLNEWGKGVAKTLDFLLKECKDNVCQLQINTFGEVRRAIRIAKVMMMRGNHVLIESHTMVGGTNKLKATWQLVSVKIHLSEDPRDAALRGVQAELSLYDVKLSHKVDVHHETKFAPSYPGLPGYCEYFTFEADGSDLPAGDFETYTYNGTEEPTSHFWTWRSRQEWSQMAADKRKQLEKGKVENFSEVPVQEIGVAPFKKEKEEEEEIDLEKLEKMKKEQEVARMFEELRNTADTAKSPLKPPLSVTVPNSNGEVEQQEQERAASAPPGSAFHLGDEGHFVFPELYGIPSPSPAALPRLPSGSKEPVLAPRWIARPKRPKSSTGAYTYSEGALRPAKKLPDPRPSSALRDLWGGETRRVDPSPRIPLDPKPIEPDPDIMDHVNRRAMARFRLEQSLPPRPKVVPPPRYFMRGNSIVLKSASGTPTPADFRSPTSKAQHWPTRAEYYGEQVPEEELIAKADDGVQQEEDWESIEMARHFVSNMRKTNDRARSRTRTKLAEACKARPTTFDVSTWMLSRRILNRRPVDPVTRSQIREVFKVMDTDAGGSVSVAELHAAFPVLGYNLTRKQIMRLIRDMDSTCPNELNFEQFVEVMIQAADKHGTSVTQEMPADLKLASLPMMAGTFHTRRTLARAIFHVEDRENLGVISFAGMKNALAHLGHANVCDKELLDMFRATGNSEGTVSMEEFMVVLTNIKQIEAQHKQHQHEEAVSFLTQVDRDLKKYVTRPGHFCV